LEALIFMDNFHCKKCGEERGANIFLWTSDELWSKMGFKEHDFVCAHCTIDALSEICSYAYLFNSEGNSQIKLADLQINVTRTTMKEKLTEKQQEDLDSAAQKIQPDEIKEERLKGCSEVDRKFYDEMTEFYKKMCEKDASFVLNFLLPESQKYLCFYRLGEPKDQVSYAKKASALFWSMYGYLEYVGYLNSLQQVGYLTVLKNTGKRESLTNLKKRVSS